MYITEYFSFVVWLLSWQQFQEGARRARLSRYDMYVIDFMLTYLTLCGDNDRTPLQRGSEGEKLKIDGFGAL